MSLCTKMKVCLKTQRYQGQLAEQFGGLGLTETQINDLTAFLSNALRDRDLTRYVPEASNSGFCFPANDDQARIDIGCD